MGPSSSFALASIALKRSAVRGGWSRWGARAPAPPRPPRRGGPSPPRRSRARARSRAARPGWRSRRSPGPGRRRCFVAIRPNLPVSPPPTQARRASPGSTRVDGAPLPGNNAGLLSHHRKERLPLHRLRSLSALLSALPAAAEEGMWTYRRLPRAGREGRLRLRALAGVAGPGAAGLGAAGRRVLGELRLAGWPGDDQPPLHPQLRGGPLRPQRDYLATGFYATELKDELRCPKVEANQLVEMTDVTARLHAASPRG